MAVNWFTKIDGKVQGPFDGRGLKLLAKNGHLKPSDHVRKGEGGSWLTAKQVTGLFGSSAAPTTAAPTSAAPTSAAPTTAAIPPPTEPDHGGQEPVFKGLVIESHTPDPPTERRPRSALATAISLLSLLVAVVALALPFLRDPLGKGVSGYDFSTPELAAKSITWINVGRDIRAHMELSDLHRGGTPEEVYRTFEVNRIADVGDKKVVFVSYMRKGKKRKELLEIEKDLESKLWLPTSLRLYEVKKTDEKLAKEMEAWTEADRGLD